MFPDTGKYPRAAYPKHMEVIAATREYNQVAFIAGNKIGKSELGCYCLATWLTGIYPHWWHGRRFPGEAGHGVGHGRKKLTGAR